VFTVFTFLVNYVASAVLYFVKVEGKFGKGCLCPLEVLEEKLGI
jgi:hypothetical protein